MASHMHNRSHLVLELLAPLLDPERLVRIMSPKCRVKACSSYFPPEIVSQPEQSEFIPISHDLSYVPPKFLQLISKGIDL